MTYLLSAYQISRTSGSWHSERVALAYPGAKSWAYSGMSPERSQTRGLGGLENGISSVPGHVDPG